MDTAACARRSVGRRGTGEVRGRTRRSGRAGGEPGADAATRYTLRRRWRPNLKRNRADAAAVPVRTGAGAAAPVEPGRRTGTDGHLGARRRSHEPTAVPVRTEHDVGWPGSSLDWYNMPGRITRLPRWSKERDTGRTLLERVEGSDSRRTGPSRTTNQDMPLEGLCRWCAGNTPVSYTIAPVHVLPITS
jgi:hypothetical protein